jgi:hypothetical protein
MLRETTQTKLNLSELSRRADGFHRNISPNEPIYQMADRSAGSGLHGNQLSLISKSSQLWLTSE